MEKIDFKKEWKHLYRPSTKDFVTVDVPPMQYLMVDGHGIPGVEQDHKDAVEALYAVSYKVKFASKKELEKDYVVPPLEGLWWAEDMESFTTKRDKSQWDWTMMIMAPDWITQEMVNRVIEDVGKKKDLPALAKLRLETLEEGLCAQIMHHGSYDDEAPTLHKLHHEWVPENGYEMAGKHHEIYVKAGDPRRGPVDPAKLRTVLRQPIREMANDKYQMANEKTRGEETNETD
jgi:hypothetical protein